MSSLTDLPMDFLGNVILVSDAKERVALRKTGRSFELAGGAVMLRFSLMQDPDQSHSTRTLQEEARVRKFFWNPRLDWHFSHWGDLVTGCSGPFLESDQLDYATRDVHRIDFAVIEGRCLVDDGPQCEFHGPWMVDGPTGRLLYTVHGSFWTQHAIFNAKLGT